MNTTLMGFSFLPVNSKKPTHQLVNVTPISFQLTLSPDGLENQSNIFWEVQMQISSHFWTLNASYKYDAMVSQNNPEPLAGYITS